MYHDTMPYKPEMPYKPTNTGDVPAKHTTTTLPQIYDRESQVTVAQRNRNRGWPACPTWLIEGEARECHGDHGRCTHMGVCACDRVRVGSVFGAAAGKRVRLRFELERGELFAFWLTRDPGGKSGGYLGGGAFGARGVRDV